MLATSAVPNMSVAEVRKALFQLREIWGMASEASPLWICSDLMNGTSIADFATELVYGHHLKRHLKSTSCITGGSQVRDDGDPVENEHATTGEATPKTYECAERAGRQKAARPGPKGTPEDPFPFTTSWKPRTDVGVSSFEKFREPTMAADPEASAAMSTDEPKTRTKTTEMLPPRRRASKKKTCEDIPATAMPPVLNQKRQKVLHGQTVVPSTNRTLEAYMSTTRRVVPTRSCRVQRSNMHG